VAVGASVGTAVEGAAVGAMVVGAAVEGVAVGVVVVGTAVEGTAVGAAVGARVLHTLVPSVVVMRVEGKHGAAHLGKLGRPQKAQKLLQVNTREVFQLAKFCVKPAAVTTIMFTFEVEVKVTVLAKLEAFLNM